MYKRTSNVTHPTPAGKCRLKIKTMTAKQIRSKLVEQIENGNHDAAKVLLIQFEIELCREQREICANAAAWSLDDDERPIQTVHRVNNAPLPEL